jgi:hypothetical protein
MPWQHNRYNTGFDAGTVLENQIRDYAEAELRRSVILDEADLKRALQRIKSDITTTLGDLIQSLGLDIDSVLSEIQEDYRKTPAGKEDEVSDAVDAVVDEATYVAENLYQSFVSRYTRTVERALYTILSQVKPERRKLSDYAEELVFGQSKPGQKQNWPVTVPKFIQEELGDVSAYTRNGVTEDLVEAATQRLWAHPAFVKQYGVASLLEAIRDIDNKVSGAPRAVVKMAVYILGGGRFTQADAANILLEAISDVPEVASIKKEERERRIRAMLRARHISIDIGNMIPYSIQKFFAGVYKTIYM